MGEGWREVAQALGRASGAPVVTAFRQQGGEWVSTTWSSEGSMVGRAWTAISASAGQMIEETLGEGLCLTGPTVGLAGLAEEHAGPLARQLEGGAALSFDLGKLGVAVLWIGLPSPPDRGRLAGLRQLVASVRCQSRCWYSQFFSHVPALFLAVDQGGVLVHCNDYVTRLGFTPRDLIGHPAAGLFASGEWERLRETLVESIETRRFKALVCHASGEIISMELMAVMVRDAAGNPAETLSLGCDLQHDGQLGHFRRLEAVERMVSGVAHELNNPLQTVVGNAEMLAGMKLSESARRRAQRVLSGAKRCQDVVDGLLKLKRKHRELAEFVELPELVRRSLRVVELEFSPLKVATRVTGQDDPPRIKGNIVDLEQALENVLRNAFQAVAREERPSVQVSIAATGETVQLMVEDNGPGLSPEALDRAFEPFFTTRGVGAGKGLGLSIALGIVQEHGGFIELQSSPAGARALIKLALEGYRPY